MTGHPNLSLADMDRLRRDCYASYYSFEHMERVLRRVIALGSNKRKTTITRLVTFREYLRLWDAPMMEGGHLRIRSRKERRPHLPVENSLLFYPREAWHLVSKLSVLFTTYARMRWKLRKIMQDPERLSWRDEALAPPAASDAMIAETRSTAYAERRRARLAAE